MVGLASLTYLTTIILNKNQLKGLKIVFRDFFLLSITYKSITCKKERR